MKLPLDVCFAFTHAIVMLWQAAEPLTVSGLASVKLYVLLYIIFCTRYGLVSLQFLHHCLVLAHLVRQSVSSFYTVSLYCPDGLQMST